MSADTARSMISDESSPLEPKETVPDSPSALLKLQSLPTERVNKVINAIEDLNLQANEMLDLAIRICYWLEALHDDHIKYHVETAMSESDRSSLVAWAIDAERLGQCKKLLEQVEV